MTINVFEGGRRIVKLATALSMALFLAFVFFGRGPYITAFHEGAPWLVGGLVFLWVLSWTTGWIVRGFLGIPMGQDRKPDTDSGH
jgi:hypothetical protein